MILALGLIWLLPALLRSTSWFEGPPAGPAAAWVADLGAHELIALDHELFVSARARMPWPVAVEARADGGVWALCAREGRSPGRHELRLLGPAGELRGRLALGVALDLCVGPGGEALVLEAPQRGEAHARVISVGAQLASQSTRVAAGASCVAAGERQLAVGTEDGWVRLFERVPFASSQAACELGGELLDLAPDIERGGWWALVGGSSARLVRLDAQARQRWSVSSDLGARSLAVATGAGGVWLAAASAPCVERFGLRGRLELRVDDLPLSGLGALAARPGGGVWIAAPGAVLGLQSDGEMLPSQGGFRLLMDLSPVPPAR